MSADVHALLRLAISYDGCSADPADPERRARFLALVGPAFERTSTCAVALLRLLGEAGCRHPLIDSPRPVKVFGDALTVARECDALHGPDYPITGGCAVVVGDLGDGKGGGPGHVYLACCAPGADELGPDGLWGIDGGQPNERGHQGIRWRRHRIVGGRDWAERATDPGAGTWRDVRHVIDCGAILERLAA